MPGIIRPPPRGILRPNQAAIDRGLSFAQAFQNGPDVPFLTRGTVASPAYVSGGYRGVLRGGVGLTGSGGYWGGNSASNSYSVSTSAGTIIVAFVSDHDAASAGNRILLYWGNTAFPAASAVAISTYAGIWYAGWADGADRRTTVSATGLYADGEVTTAGLTWDGAGQTAYMGGRVIATGAAVTYGSTAGSDFILGNYVSSFPWISSTYGGILYALSFDRALSPSEMAQANADLWWWVQRPRQRVGVSTTAYTMPVDPLAYQYTGQAIGLNVGRMMAVSPLEYVYGGADVGLSTTATTASGVGPARTRRGARRVYLPEAQPTAVFHPNALPEELAAHAVKAWQDDEDDETWFLLA